MRKVIIFVMVAGFLILGTLSVIAEETEGVFPQEMADFSDSLEGQWHGGPAPCGGGGSGGGGEGGAPG